MLGERLVELRKHKGLTQEEFSCLLNISRGTYAQYEIERRQPDYDTLEKIADYYNVSVDYLLGRTDNPISYESQRLINKFSVSYKDLQPTPPERVRTFQKKVGELSEESFKFLEFQLERLRELDEEAVKRRRSERDHDRNG